MCAIEAGKRGRSVLVIERSEKIGKKILISGGGRCNFTNRSVTFQNFISENPHFCKSALSRFTPQDFITLVEKHGIPYHEKKLGQLFCDTSSTEIIHLLEKECQAAHVEIITSADVLKILKNNCFEIGTNQGNFESQSLVIATGGLSIPKMGATAFGYEMAKQFGLPIVECNPALVPFTWSKKDAETFGSLAGISFPARVRFGNQSFYEDILITHKGLSGPAILQISSYWQHGAPVYVDLLPEKNILETFIKGRNSGLELSVVLAQYLPKRFIQKWWEQMVPEKFSGPCSDKELKEILDRIHSWPIIPSGTEGYDKAEVTSGGVHTTEFSSTTLESKKVKGLFFIGEVMDVTGHLGGYNFQWAWSSGFAAGQFV